MKFAENIKRPPLPHLSAWSVGIAYAIANSNLFIRRHCKVRLETSLKAHAIPNNAGAHRKRIRFQDNVVYKTAIIQPLLAGGITINHSQQTNLRFIEVRAATFERSTISPGRVDILRPGWQSHFAMGFTGCRDVYKIRERTFSKYLNALRLIVTNARRPAGILKNALNLRPCRTARAKGSYDTQRGGSVQNEHCTALSMNAGGLI